MAVHLPMTRVRTIMKSSADVDIVSKESIFVITRAAEFFIKMLSLEAHKDSNKAKKLEYDHVANIVNSDNRYEFLNEIIPQKITVAEYFKIMKDKNVLLEAENNKSTSSSSGSSESDSSVNEPDSDVECIEDSEPEGPDAIENAEDSDSDIILIE